MVTLELLFIDVVEVDRVIERFILEKVREHGVDGVCLGVSGGLDSATVLYLTANAIGADKVHSLYLPDKESISLSLERARALTNAIGVNLMVRDITSEADSHGVYKSKITKAAGISGKLNKYLLRSLMLGPRWVRRYFRRKLDDSFEKRIRLRQKILLEYSIENNLLCFGTVNRTEYFYGWFIPWGEFEVIQPIMGLYKLQVDQLAEFLGIPNSIIKVPSSPDMIKGLNNTDLAGYSFDVLDNVANIHEKKLGPDKAEEIGIIKKVYDELVRRHKMVRYRHASQMIYPEI